MFEKKEAVQFCFVSVHDESFIKKFYLTHLFLSYEEAGTKVGPDQLGPPVRVGSTRTNSDRIKKNNNKIKLDSDQLGAIKKIKLNQQN